MSSSSSQADESDDSFNDDLMLEDEGNFEDNPIHAALEQDIKHFKLHCPSEKIICRKFDSIQEIDIEMTLNIDFIKENILDAWGLSPMMPLNLKLNLNSPLNYQTKNFSKVDVFQDVKETQSGTLIQLKNIVKGFCTRQFDPNFTSTYEGLERVMTSSATDRSEKQGSCNTEGFLLQLYTYILQRLETLNEYCPICDKHHGAYSMLKPTICSNPLCIFSSQTLGVMCQVKDSLQTQPKVVNLLISFTSAAVASSRHKNVLKPFPAVTDSSSQDFLFSDDENGLKILRKIMTILSSLSFQAMSSELELKEHLDSHHKHCYPLLRWIVSSNRSHIICLQESKQLQLMNTPFQFVMRNSPPTEDANFRALAKEFGSCFAFHGSPLENWHSIVRQGLIVASGTDLQLHGAVWGKGIYVSPHLKTALSYAGHTGIKRASAKAKKEDKGVDIGADNKFCVALCEVIMGPNTKKGSTHWIIEKSQHVCTRFFFLYPHLQASVNIVDSNSDQFVESVKTILSEI